MPITTATETTLNKPNANMSSLQTTNTIEVFQFTHSELGVTGLDVSYEARVKVQTGRLNFYTLTSVVVV